MSTEKFQGMLQKRVRNNVVGDHVETNFRRTCRKKVSSFFDQADAEQWRRWFSNNAFAVSDEIVTYPGDSEFEKVLVAVEGHCSWISGHGLIEPKPIAMPSASSEPQCKSGYTQKHIPTLGKEQLICRCGPIVIISCGHTRHLAENLQLQGLEGEQRVDTLHLEQNVEFLRRTKLRMTALVCARTENGRQRRREVRQFKGSAVGWDALSRLFFNALNAIYCN